MLVADDQLEGYTACRESVEKIAVFLKPFIDQGVLQATASVPRPVLKKIIALLSYQILEEDGRIRIIKAAHSIAERIITELLVMHQNQQQISSLIWSAVRARGCQFLGPVMQEEALKLILKLLENERAMSRKTIVMYVVQQMLPDFQNASKTNIGHIVQLLYRASCFKVKYLSCVSLSPPFPLFSFTFLTLIYFLRFQSVRKIHH
jgi:RING finger/CCCH-type zinc finger protein